MRKARIAQWILSLVSTPERAAATAGDLIEAAAVRGALWFWASVLGTTSALLWRDFSAEPARMMGLAVRGMLVGFGVLVVVLLVLVVLLGILLGVYFYLTGTANAAHPILTLTGQVLGFILGGILIPFYVGQWLARRSPEREMAACLAAALLTFVLEQAVGLAWLGAENSFLKFFAGLAGTVAWTAVLQIPMFAGAARIRRQRLRTR